MNHTNYFNCEQYYYNTEVSECKEENKKDQ